MTGEAFEREMLGRLKAHFLRYPYMQPEDAVKFVFQGMLGVGHLLSSREQAADRIAREMNGLTPDADRPLFELLSPSWCRLDLRRAMAERLRPQVIAGLMLASGYGPRFTRRDVFDPCRKLSRAEDAPLFRDLDPEEVLDESWLPSHSDIYREKYRPAYRVVSSDWIPCAEALQRIAEKEEGGELLLVTLDGPCASGKTTLARKLAEVFRGEVVHTDDFVIPHRLKTPDRLSIPGGNCDAERLILEVVSPFKSGLPVIYRRYDCASDSLTPQERLPDSQVLILEGSYCNLPDIRKYADVRLFLDTPPEVREARLGARESPSSLRQFYERWIPLENAYFSAFRLPDEDCVLIGSG